jgi:hypothetical protein
MKNLSKYVLQTALCAVMAFGFVSQSAAQDKKADGTWTWTMQGRQGGPDRKMTLKLKTEDGKLTGKLSSPGRNQQTTETDIKDAKIKDGEISFSVVREVQGNTMTTKYSGKITGDTIKGKMEGERQGQPFSRDWEAKREAAK